METCNTQKLHFNLKTARFFLVFSSEVGDYHDKAEPGLGIINPVVFQRKEKSLSVALRFSVKLLRNFLYIIV